MRKLGSLSISDTVNSANSQICLYGYDDLARVACVACGTSIWKQNFTYDPYGNITKSVPTGGTGISFASRYSSNMSATNRLTLRGRRSNQWRSVGIERQQYSVHLQVKIVWVNDEPFTGSKQPARCS